MRVNNIVKYNLESSAKDLKSQNKSFEDIAELLSKDAPKKISAMSVCRYFKSNEIAVNQVIEKKEELQVKLAEVEISTIEDRQTIIKGLLTLATGALEDRDKVLAYKEANVALDSLDKRIGKLINNPNVTINNSNTMKLQDVNSLTDEQLVFIINNG